MADTVQLSKKQNWNWTMMRGELKKSGLQELMQMN